MSNEHVNGHTYSDPISKNFKEHRIRIIIDKEGEPWWIASDICDILGLKTNDAVSILDDDEIRIDQFKHDAVDFEFNRVLVNRSGAYSIIIVSDYPHKKEFRKFITNQLIVESNNHLPGHCNVPAPVETQDFASLQPVVAIIDDQPMTTSVDVANVWGKRHKDLLKKIESNLADIPAEICQRYFRLTSVDVPMPNGGTRKEKAYLLTSDGFVLAAMGTTGERAMRVKLAYINAFNRMQETLEKQLEEKLRNQYALPDPTVIANAKKEAAGNALKLAEHINKTGIGMNGLARLCSLRRANLTQDECAILVNLMDIWDTLNDLSGLEGMVNSAAYLADPERRTDDDECARMHGLLMDISVRLGNAVSVLEKARNNPIVI